MKRRPLLTILTYIVIYTTFYSCKKEATYAPARIKGQHIPISPNIVAAQEITDLIKPYKEAIQAEMDSVLAYAPFSHTKKDSKLNTAVGNMMADAVFEMAAPVFKKRAGYPFQAVLLNYGGIRSALNKGNITTRTAYELMPFENEVVVVELSGRQIKELFDYLKSGTAHPFSGMEIVLTEDGEIKKAHIQGQEVLDNETYFIATNDYLKNGGDGMDFFAKPISTLSLDYKIRNVLIDYFKKYDTISPVKDNRFRRETK